MTDKSEPCFTERARTCLFITRISFKGKRQTRQRNIRHRYRFGTMADEIICGYFIQLRMPILSGSHPARSTAGGYQWIHSPADSAPL